ncbi:MAG TPA: helical backbone metal receptor, partial [Gemmatimonadaceae bacterium]|nr:helical backbone metal receptor [Gemmatimonadaceae bacterium]
QIVGRTRYDDAPEVQHLPSVGGGLDPSLEALAALRPELVLAWELTPGAGTRGQVEALGVPTFALQTPDTTTLFRTVERLGHLTGRDSGAAALAARLRAELDSVRRMADAAPRRRVFYVVSTSPAMTAGPDTFVGQLLSLAGGDNIFPEAGAGWPTVSLEEIVRRDPELIVLPVGEDPTNSLAELRARPGWREIPAVRDGRVVTVPAGVVNRPGPRVGEAARMLYGAMRDGRAE